MSSLHARRASCLRTSRSTMRRGGDAPLVALRELIVSVSLPSLLTNHIVLPHLGLTDGQLNLVRDKDGRANWKLRKSDEPETRTFEVGSLALNNAKLSLRDAVQNIEVDATGVSRRRRAVRSACDT